MLSDPRGFWVATSNTRIAPLDLVSAQSGTEGLRDGIRRTLDDEIEAMALAMSSIRSRRNALSFPCRLPSEILARCFWFLVAADPPRSASSLGWIHILHVSAHFRHVALTEPTLWTEISFFLGLGWAGRMVSLAKAAPLSIKETLGIYLPTRNDAIRNVVRDHISHIRELVIEEDPVSLANIVNVAEPAPILETLDLRLRSLYIHSTNEHQILPANFLNNNAPCLRTINLHGFQLPSTAFPLLSTVVSLTIKLLRSSNSPFPVPPPSYYTFFSMLETATRLESLSLENYLPSTADDSSAGNSSGVRSVSLPHLTKLRVHGPTTDCAFVLRHLNFPHTTQLEVESQINDRDHDASSTQADNTSVLFSALIPHTRGETSPRIRTLHITIGWTYIDSIEVKAWELSGTQTRTGGLGSGAPLFSHSSEPAALSLRLEHSHSQKPSLSTIVTLFDLSDLRALYLSMPGQVIEKDQWINTLRPCTQLQYVMITGDSIFAIRFCCALLPAETVKPPSTTKSRGGGRGRRGKQKRGGTAIRNSKAEIFSVAGPSTAEVILPNLISLDLQGVNFEHPTPGHSKPFHDFLVVLLSKRKAIGKPIHRLSLSDCVVNEDWVADLEEVVPQVEWDGGTGSVNEDEEDEEESEEGIYGYAEEYYGYGYDSDPYDDPFYDSDDIAMGW